MQPDNSAILVVERVERGMCEYIIYFCSKHF